MSFEVVLQIIITVLTVIRQMYIAVTSKEILEKRNGRVRDKINGHALHLSKHKSWTSLPKEAITINVYRVCSYCGTNCEQDSNCRNCGANK